MFALTPNYAGHTCSFLILPGALLKHTWFVFRCLAKHIQSRVCLFQRATCMGVYEQLKHAKFFCVGLPFIVTVYASSHILKYFNEIRYKFRRVNSQSSAELVCVGLFLTFSRSLHCSERTSGTIGR